ncbi:hypothetical protein BGZ83_010534 [Gryganskiella cystojenkinii]|nr:hypothetical protein BGZ83_010534 [Gryganskiella cystojenkinii]
MESKANLHVTQFKKHIGNVVLTHRIDYRGVDPRDIEVVVNELRATYGWKADSDLLFMRANTLIRFQSKCTRFYSYPILKILEQDYDANVAKASFKIALNEIKTIRKSRSRERIVDRSTEGYVKEYCRRKGIYFNTVQNSIESFVNLKETPLEHCQTGERMIWTTRFDEWYIEWRHYHSGVVNRGPNNDANTEQF